ncbi:MAG: oligosaccharide flippase family protein [Chloroflexi bacterium]|nr:oligosaccharide flippase family protein [Chloroflexota bacterium]
MNEPEILICGEMGSVVQQLDVRPRFWARLDDWVTMVVARPGVRHGAIVFTATSLVNTSNYVYHALMSRLLGPSEYGVLVSLLGLFAILSAPANVLQLVSARYTAQLAALGQTKRAGDVVVQVLRWGLIAGAVGFISLSLGSNAIAGYLQLPALMLVTIVGGMVLVTLAVPAFTGAFQGLQRFELFGGALALSALARLGFGVVLVLLGWKTAGALGATILAGLAVGVLAAMVLRPILQQREPAALVTTRVLSYSLHVVLAMAAFTALTNLDVLIVKHYFSAAEAGYYGVASALGKVVLFFPSAVALVLFPKAARRQTLQRSSRDLILGSVTVTALLSGVVILAYAVSPTLPVRLLAGNQYLASASLVVPLGIAMAGFALVNVWMFYYLSCGAKLFVYGMVGGVGMELLLLLAFHATLFQVILGLMGSAGALSLFAAFLLGHMEDRAGGDWENGLS